MTFRQLFNLAPQPGNRLAWIDYAKGIAIFMVVYRHLTIGMHIGGVPINESLFEVINEAGLTFRMPLFFLLSGIFFSMSVQKHSQTGYILHKSKTILYPYLIWAFIFTTLQITMSDHVNSHVNLWSYFNILIDPWGHWWFLLTLFNVSILYLVLFMLLRGKQAVLLAIGLIFYFTANYLIDFSIAFHTMRLFIFFVVGGMVSKAILDIRNQPILASGWLLAFFLVLSVAGEWMLFNGYGQSETGQEIWRNGTISLLFFSLTGSCTIIWLSYRLSLQKTRYISFIRLLGQHSLYIYLLHSIIGAGVRITLVSVFGFQEYWTILFVSLAASLILPVLLYRFCTHFGFWFLFSPDLPPKQASLKPLKSKTTIPTIK